jgi:hypothetical protein
MAQDTIEEEAASLGAELQEEYVEVKATVDGDVDLALGDFVQVVKSDADINRRMRVHRLVTTPAEDSVASTVQKALLSTRTILREELGSDTRDIQRYNTAWQGASVSVQGGGSRQPVDNQNNAEIPFNYPNIEFENQAELFVRGLPYRGYSAGSSNIDTPIFNVVDSRDLVTNTRLAPGASTTITVNTGSGYNDYIAFLGIGVETLDPNDVTVAAKDRFEVDVFNVTEPHFVTGEFTTTENIGTWELQQGSVEVEPGDDIEVQFENPKDNEDLVLDGNTIVRLYEVNHRHNVDPGIDNFASETPSNVDVLIDGNTVATDIGSGEFETSVDISDELTPDAWNFIELTSDTLGHIQATISIDGYKRIGIN